MFRTLATESAAQRAHNPGLEAGRVDVIVGGAAVLVGIFRVLGFDEMLVSEADILDGLARSQLALTCGNTQFTGLERVKSPNSGVVCAENVGHGSDGVPRRPEAADRRRHPSRRRARWRATPRATRSTPGTRRSPSTAPSVTPTARATRARAAWDAAQTVQHVAEANGMRLPDVDVTHVARAAAEIARGMIAGDDVALEVHQLLQHWFPVLARA